MPREVQITEAVELVLKTDPTAQELADSRVALLDRSEDTVRHLKRHNYGAEDVQRELQDRAIKAEVLAIAEEIVNRRAT